MRFSPPIHNWGVGGRSALRDGCAEAPSLPVETLRKYGIVEMARRLIKPYPGIEADLEEALKREEVRSLGLHDLVFLFKHQNELCDKCGRCCRTESPIHVSPHELSRIAEYLRVSYEELKRRLKLIPLRDGTYHLIGKPCPFLKGNLCSIYEVRPEVCRLYPARYIYARAVDGKPMSIDLECGVMKKLFAYKLAAAAVMIKLEREVPELFNKMVAEVRGLWEKFMPSEERMEDMPVEVQITWLERWLRIFKAYVEER